MSNDTLYLFIDNNNKGVFALNILPFLNSNQYYVNALYTLNSLDCDTDLSLVPGRSLRNVYYTFLNRNRNAQVLVQNKPATMLDANGDKTSYNQGDNKAIDETNEDFMTDEYYNPLKMNTLFYAGDIHDFADFYHWPPSTIMAVYGGKRAPLKSTTQDPIEDSATNKLAKNLYEYRLCMIQGDQVIKESIFNIYYVDAKSGVLYIELPTSTASGIYNAIVRYKGEEKVLKISVVNMD